MQRQHRRLLVGPVDEREPYRAALRAKIQARLEELENAMIAAYAGVEVPEPGGLRMGPPGTARCTTTVTADPLRTRRVLLLPPAPEEAPALLDALRASAAELGAWAIVSEQAATSEGVLRMIARARRRIEAGTHLVWRLWTPRPLHLIGSVSVHTINRDAGSGELGYWLRSAATGHGYATEACDRVLRFLFHVPPKFKEIAVRCDSRNQRALNVAHRLGARWPCRRDRVVLEAQARTIEVFRFTSPSSSARRAAHA